MAIGGVGGSGTRVIAMILQKAGVDIGSYVNGSLDNVFFARFICRHSHQTPYRKMRLGFLTFQRSYFGRTLFPQNIYWILKSVKSPLLKRLWLHIRRSREGKATHHQYLRWGWKEPRTMYFLEQTAQHYPKLKYIHVMRNGLDMSYSENTQQFQRWGADFDIQFPEGGPSPSDHLNFWINVNTWAINQCTELGIDHFVLKFEDLCEDPTLVIAQLFEFLAFQPEVSLDELAGLVRVPSSLNRHKNHPYKFTDDQIASVKSFGFSA